VHTFQYLGELSSVDIPSIEQPDDFTLQEELDLPILNVSSVILYPGDILPLRVDSHDVERKATLQRAMRRHKGYFGVMTGRRRGTQKCEGKVCVIARIKEMREEDAENAWLTVLLAQVIRRCRLVALAVHDTECTAANIWSVRVLRDEIMSSQAYLMYSSRLKSIITPFPSRLYDAYDCIKLGKKALSLFRSARELEGGGEADCWKDAPSQRDAEALSFWLSRMIAGSDEQKLQLLETRSTYERLKVN
jgi:hypothetical protein